jgi:hypothetical protein
MCIGLKKEADVPYIDIDKEQIPGWSSLQMWRSLHWRHLVQCRPNQFGKQSALTVRRGKKHDYLGIQFDFSKTGKVVMTMNDYITELIEETPDDLLKGIAT